MAVISIGGFLASGTNQIVAQEGAIELQVVAVGGTIPVTVGEFDTAVWGASVPTGIAYNTLTDEYAITDSTDDEVYIVNNKGELQSQFNTSGYPSTNPTGIACDSTADEYAIVDSSADEIFFVRTAGLLSSQCDTAGVGILAPTGIAFNSANGFYAITDSSQDEVFIVDGACIIQGQFDTSIHGVTNPLGITYRTDTDRYEVVGSSADEFLIFDASAGGLGTLISQFDTAASSITTPAGLAFNPDDRVSAIVDSGWDQIFPVDHRGTLVSTFDTAALGIFNPSDLSLNTTTGNLLITDDSTDFVTTVTTAGAFVTSCSAAFIGATNVQGIAYLPSTDQFALIDNDANEVFITSATCVLSSQFDTSNLESETPSGLGVDQLFGDLTLTDNSDEAIRFADTAGTLKSLCPGAGLGFDGGLGGGPIDGLFNILDIDHISSAGNFVVVDSNDDEIVVFNTMCLPLLHFDTGGLPATLPEGIAVDNAAKRVFMVDNTTDEVYEFDVPRFFEATTLSGSFVSGGIVLNLKETGDGFISGDVILPSAAAARQFFGRDVKIHGSGLDIALIFGSSALTIDVMVDLGAGPVAFSGTVASDLNSLVVAGTPLTRQ